MTETLKPYYEILVKHSDFFDLWNREKYISQSNEVVVQAIFEAYKKIEPNAQSPFGCAGCVKDMLHYANIHRVTYMSKLPKEPTKHTFPQHKKK